jgi:ferredoxin-NADP reductase
MERTAVLGRLTWQIGEVIAAQPETARARSLTIAMPHWLGHRAGQHVDVRLTAEDGYQAQRSYSIASPPTDDGHVAITVERLDDGEVSPYLVDELQVGDQIELRGPIGGYFVWEPALGGPLLLVAGGSGIVPLMAMIRNHAAAMSDVPTRLLYSARTLPDVIYRSELTVASPVEVSYTLTRAQPPGWTGYARRIDAEMLREVAWPAADSPLAFVCGPTPFVESAAAILVDLGYAPERIRTERFGATGG